MITVAIFLGAALAAYFLTGLVRRYALALQLLDVPTSRSSHAVPTPRGGGLAIVCVVMIGLVLLWFMGQAISDGALLALGLGGAAVAAIGWWDDRASLPAHVRLAVHLLAAAFVIWLGGSMPTWMLPGSEWAWSLLSATTAVLFIAWLLNLYNFMDGIDGLAGTEAVTVAGVSALLLLWQGEPGWAMLSAIVALASAGFLAWNWPPAKIFMGDAGSGFLGFVLGSLAVLTWLETPIAPWPWLILLAVFILDATVTLGRRALRREPIHEAHRDHAYQHAARHFGAHRPVTIAVLLINLFWLTPWAVAATAWPTWGMIFLAVAWAPLLWLCVQFRAGMPD